jgi:phosphohistidine swiveling domain-containing protein
MTTTRQARPRILGIGAINGEAVGGKAEGLNRLTSLGFPVPPAFVILDITNPDVLPDNLEQAYSELGGGKVAVRSSALGEDGVEASFAGQYETLLDVEGITELEQAIRQCVASLDSARATAYQAQQSDLGEVQMCVVVQRMVDAASAGVLFSADPVSGRHDRLVIDAVQGLGEALVSGESTPDHYELAVDNTLVASDLVGETPILSQTQLQALANQAREAVERYGMPLDLEWAIDHGGELFWLQARPITTLGADLNELDTPIPNDHVITRCNVGEMMPGAVCPLTFDVQGRAIEHGMQHMHVMYGGRPAITQDWTQINQFFGHLFINMTQGLEAARYSQVANRETMAQSLCGRPIEELKDPANKAPIWRRLWGGVQFIRYCLQAGKMTVEFESRFKHMHVEYFDNSADMMTEMEKKFPWLCETNEVHLRSSAGSGVMEGVIQGIVSSGQQPPSYEQQAEAARLLAGAQYVESAMMVDQLDEVVDTIARHPDALEQFKQTTTTKALAWLRSDASGSAGKAFADFIARHGHRTFRELCVREQGWIDEPEKLIETMQASLAARLQGNYKKKQHPHLDYQTLPRALRWLLPKAHNAIRQREQTKSLLVEATHRLKRGYRHLGEVLTQEGHLPDADLVFFFTRAEMRQFVDKPSAEWVEKVQQRRVALSFNERLEFDDISVGKPEPVIWKPSTSAQANKLVGRPVSRGFVEGPARVAITISEAAQLQPGEILIAPITDVGWTPYFSLIAGLATDVGSAVSHGAVVAREYGLPAIVNLRTATKIVKTGDIVRLDADLGVLTILKSETNLINGN